MRRQTLTLLGLFLAICGWTLWARWPAMQPVAAGEVSPLAQATTPPTALPPMPTPAMTRQVEADWQTYSSPYWGVSFRYPPGWSVTGAETTARLPTTASPSEATYIADTVGVPIFISPTTGEDGSLYLILAYYTLSEGGSLAEWVANYNEYFGRMGLGGPIPLHLSTIPTSYLPAGVTQGVFAIGEHRVNLPRTLWLERDGLIYNFNSVYNRPEDVARMFAIAASMEFDPDAEARLRASGGFRGDDETLRQELAKMDAEIADDCDPTCEYIREMEERERWKTLPAAERPLVQPIRPAAIDDPWQTYTQTVLGISFRYGSEMQIIDPFAEKDSDESSLFDKAISIVLGHSPTQEVMKIELFPYTVSEDVPLHNWEAIQDQLDRARNPFNRYQYRLSVPIEWGYAAQHVDDMVHTQDQAPYYRIETFWLSKDGVVFKVTSSYPYLATDALRILSTIDFEPARLEELRALGLFAGDERTMVDELVQEWAKPRPTVDPNATPTPIPTPTPWPSPTPAPTVRDTVTPSAFNSPLVNGLQRYQGNSNYTGYPSFEIWFDPTLWQLRANEEDTNYLVHQEISGCEIIPDGWATHVIPLASVTLAGVQWGISYFPTTAGEFIAYSRGWDNIGYTLLVSLPTPIPQMYDPAHKSQCELDAEAVIGTHTVLEATSTNSPTPPSFDATLPTVTPTPENK
ncbi:MAG: hypothetical protein IT328_06630 [Caldilineaceae bacterium]|nr:hypothetical protein [Caldilineaceae bacterium]